MGITLIIVMSMLAFIINVGLFVKAKINLQNATDAAAFSGAATQARQLTNIAYANWELRNTYKEWMFKYYVLGQLGLFPYNLQASRISGKQTVNFLLVNPPISGINDYDKYNVPSICIHNNSENNICPIYALPGIPRFPAIGVAGISEIQEAFVDELASGKAKDCSSRSSANFLTAMNWAYGSGLEPIPGAPLIAANRPGAWPQSLELALRIRNLEMIVNNPPVADITRENIRQFQGRAEEIGLNERPVKAFWSGYRNLGGGAYKDCATGSANGAPCTPDELSLNFRLTELVPQPYIASDQSVSGFLIPKDWTYSNGGSALQKHYLDLQLMPVNLATMFSTFVSTTANNDRIAGMENVSSEAACGVSKSALPVPGYIMGFTKNPQVLTYYAVKAESKFIGLFLPSGLGGNGGITLTAYSAAKPFGGRIGPKLFGYTEDGTVIARDQDPNHRTSSVVSGLKVEVGSSGFKPGMPIPSSSDFWVNQSNPIIGGIPGRASKVYFGIPNMIYDFEDAGDLTSQASSNSPIQLISSDVAAAKPTLGLYHAPQFRALKASLGNINQGTTISGDDILKAIIRARRPTKYDAINYLVPHFEEVSEKNNAAPVVQKLQNILDVGYSYKLFAPLIGPNLLYKTADAVGDVVITYMQANNAAVEDYLKALLEVGNSIYNLEPAQVRERRGNSNSNSRDAAKTIHANAGPPGSTGPATPAFLKYGALATDPDCKLDMASKFNHFFRAESTGCEIVPLKVMMIDYVNKQAADPNKSLFYISYFYYEPARIDLTLPPESLMTAYYPGTRQGATLAGIIEHPLKLTLPGNASYSAKRNYYSTKFFQMKKVIENKSYKDQPVLREEESKLPEDLIGLPGLLNPLTDSSVSNNYFLDF